MKCNISPCEWHWCKKNKDCWLNKTERGEPINYNPNQVGTEFKRKRIKGGKLKKRVEPIQIGGSIEENLYECHYCGIELSYESMTIDHKTPLSKSGSNHKSNLVSCCSKCNGLKGNRDYREYKEYLIRRKNLLKLL